MLQINKIKLLISLALFLLFLSPVVSYAASEEKIKEFAVDIQINPDASLIVSETITYDFGGLQRHGIYRTIPLGYERDGKPYYLKLQVLGVVNEENEKYKYTTKKTGNQLEIKIGDPDVFISGVKTYEINYVAESAINYFSDHDELYWNVTGNEWPVPIERASARVILPGNIASEKIQKTCYAGLYGARNQNCFSQFEANGTVVYGLTEPLAPNQGLTLVCGFPKNMVAQKIAAKIAPQINFQAIYKVFLNKIWLGLPILTFLILLDVWRRRGRDPRGRGAIIPWYGPPDDLTPGEIGTIVDEKINPRDITATIINLAVRGYLKIQEVENKVLFFRSNDWKFIKLKEHYTLSEGYEAKLMRAIFSDKYNEKLLSFLREEFALGVPVIKKTLYGSLTKKGYFLTRPDHVRWLYLGIGLGIITLSLFVFFAVYLLIGLLFSGIIIMAFSPFMPRKTQKGTEAHEKILGFKMYLEVAEKDRLEFHNAPEKRPETFEKFLPYAIALGVEKQWANQFKNIYTTPPTWFVGNNFNNFTTLVLINNLSNFSSQANRILITGGAGGGHSGLNGGGFSGGGFGGGGGGSW